MITADGWLDWAIRTPAPWSKTNSGINPALGIFLHSAEGYADNLLNLVLNGPLSWHASNMMSGALHQHYPFTARCWHAGNGPNQSYIGMENEGVYTVEHSLNEAQIANAARVIKDLSEWKGWMPKRSPDASQTCWEHNEAPRIGGLPSQCPSGRIPWDAILAALTPSPAPALVGIGLHFTDGTDRELWNAASTSQIPDGIGARYNDGSTETIWAIGD